MFFYSLYLFSRLPSLPKDAPTDLGATGYQNVRVLHSGWQGAWSPNRRWVLGPGLGWRGTNIFITGLSEPRTITVENRTLWENKKGGCQGMCWSLYMKGAPKTMPCMGQVIDYPGSSRAKHGNDLAEPGRKHSEKKISVNSSQQTARNSAAIVGRL